MASSVPLCGICDLQHTSNPATVWCSECDEGFCIDCNNHHRLAKLSRHHTTTPIEEYQKLPAYVQELEQFCREHDEKIILFCKDHDSPCCLTCSLQNHNKCHSVSKIDDVIKNVKTSHAFHEIQQNLTELSENIPKILNDRKENLVSLNNSKLQVENEIKEFRAKVNQHLDKLQDNIIKELNKAEETERKLMKKMVDDFGQTEKDINELQVNLSSIKQHASDLQAYLAIKQIQNDVDKTDKIVDSLVNSDKLQQKILSFEINSKMKDILSNIKSFGKIVVERKGCDVVITKKKNQQAQLFIPIRQRTMDDITLTLQQTLNVKSSNIINGCCILPDGRMVFTSSAYKNKKLIFINTDGTENTVLTIPLAYDVTYVKYNNSLAVTSAHNQCITFINLKNNKVEETIKLGSDCYGITEKDNKLFFCTDDCIESMGLSDKSITKIINTKKMAGSFIDTYQNNVYHTNSDTNIVTCYDLSGQVKWEFKDESIIKGLYGISVDNQGNVYVAGYQTSKVVVISPDGQKYRELLTNKDKLDQPYALSYDKSTDSLLVSNRYRNAFLYKIT